MRLVQRRPLETWMHISKRVINTVLRGGAAVDFSGHQPVESNPEGWRQRMEHLKLEQVSAPNLSPGLCAVAVLEASKAVLSGFYYLVPEPFRSLELNPLDEGILLCSTQVTNTAVPGIRVSLPGVIC